MFDLVAEWLRHLDAMGYGEGTLRTYGGAVNRALTWMALRGLDPLDVTEADVEGYIASIGKHGPARSQAALSLRSLYSLLHRRGHVAADPTAYLRPKPVPPPPAKAFSEEEVTRLVYAAACRHERRGWAVLLCFTLGTRRSELAGLRPEDVDQDAVLVRGKGRKQRRIELGPVGRAALEGLRPWWNGTVLGRGHGGEIRPATVTAWVHDAAKDAGLGNDRRRAHMLRSGMASYLDRRHVPATVIRDRLGHASIKTTERYLPSWEEDRRTTAEAWL